MFSDETKLRTLIDSIVTEDRRKFSDAFKHGFAAGVVFGIYLSLIVVGTTFAVLNSSVQR